MEDRKPSGKNSTPSTPSPIPGFHFIRLVDIITAMKSFKNKLIHYFEENIVGYTYLFFAQGAFVAENIYWNELMKGDFGNAPMYSIIGFYNLYAFILIYSLPAIFITGALLTFKYPKDKSVKMFLFIIHLAFCMLILSSSLIQFWPYYAFRL